MLYPELIEGLLEYDIDSHVLVVLPKNKNTIGLVAVNPNVTVVLIPNVINMIAKIFPILRVLYIFKFIDGFKDQNIDVIHSHTVHSNGSIGSWLSKRLKVPLVLSIRNVDINTVYKNLFFYRKMILRRITSNKTIFINMAYFDFINKEIKIKNIGKEKNKSEVIPNSINSYWIKNKYHPKQLKSNVVNVLFVGEYTPNKNIDFLLDVFETQWLKDLMFNVQIIGSLDTGLKDNCQYHAHIKSRVKRLDNIKLLEKVTEKEALLKYYRNSDIFFMTSFYETFGLVYAEAMSQGLPIIYTEGQGIDGFYEEGDVGFPVDPTNVEQARSCVGYVVDNYQKISQNCISFVDDFSKEVNINKLVNTYTKCKRKQIVI
jgi:glycosyltransferase involved in cell wall biosynthesis